MYQTTNQIFTSTEVSSGQPLILKAAFRSNAIAQNYGSDGYLGYLDEFRIYDQALSASEISTMYDLSKTWFHTPIQILDANVSTISSRGTMHIFLRMIKAFGVWEIIITGNLAMELPLHDPPPYKS